MTNPTKIGNTSAQCNISVVLPIYNELENLSETKYRLDFILKALSLSYEVIWVDDGSTDGSKEMIKSFAKDPEHKFIFFTRNFGHQQALFAGMSASRGDVIVTMDADLQDPPEIIPQLYEAYSNGNPVVYAKRISRKGESIFKKATAYLFYRLLQRITSITFPQDVGDFRLISREIMDQLLKMPETNRYLRGQIAWLGYPTHIVKYERAERFRGKSKFSTGKMVRFALDGITSFSNLPLQIASIAGFIFSAVAFLTMLYALYSKFILDTAISGWASIMVSSMFVGGIQLLCIGIIGEYIARIASDSRKRPDYVIHESNIKEP